MKSASFVHQTKIYEGQVLKTLGNLVYVAVENIGTFLIDEKTIRFYF